MTTVQSIADLIKELAYAAVARREAMKLNKPGDVQMAEARIFHLANYAIDLMSTTVTHSDEK